MNNNIEEYLNLIELLKQALLFYSNKNNYAGSHIAGALPRHSNDCVLANIDADDYGHQARFALDKIKEFEEIRKNMDMDYKNFVSEEDNENQEDILNIINKLKND